MKEKRENLRQIDDKNQIEENLNEREGENSKKENISLSKLMIEKENENTVLQKGSTSNKNINLQEEKHITTSNNNESTLKSSKVVENKCINSAQKIKEESDKHKSNTNIKAIKNNNTTEVLDMSGVTNKSPILKDSMKEKISARIEDTATRTTEACPDKSTHNNSQKLVDTNENELQDLSKYYSSLVNQPIPWDTYNFVPVLAPGHSLNKSYLVPNSNQHADRSSIIHTNSSNTISKCNCNCHNDLSNHSLMNFQPNFPFFYAHYLPHILGISNHLNQASTIGK